MSLAVRAVSVNRGIDPRDTTLIAFGGAGPLHAVAIAREISIPRVVIPKLPGNFSALGMLMAQWRQDFVRTLIGQLGEIRPADATRAFAELRSAGEAALARDHLAGGCFDFAADLRYRGQEHTIAIPVDARRGARERHRGDARAFRRAARSPLRPCGARPVDRGRQSAPGRHRAAHAGRHRPLAVGAVDAGRSGARAAPAGGARRSRAPARGAHPVAAGARGRHRDRRTGGDRGAEFHDARSASATARR